MIEGRSAASSSASNCDSADPASASTFTLQHEIDYEIDPTDLVKWKKMMETGIRQYKQENPDIFQRRVRRGIPPEHRWEVWKVAVDIHDFELPKNYQALSQTEHKWTSAIEADITRTFPELKSFDRQQQLRLWRVLNAYAAYKPQIGYCQGMNFVAGLLLLVSNSEEESFRVLVRLMDDIGFSGFYTERLPLLQKYVRMCERQVAETMPDLRRHFVKEKVQPALYLHQWFLTFFINSFPLPMVLVIWDNIICEGLPVILKIATSILEVMKDLLLSMHFEGIIRFFQTMKISDGHDGELNAFKIGQLLVKHAEHVVIPEHVLEQLNQELPDDGSNADENFFEADVDGEGWFQSFTRVLPFGSSRRGYLV